jgi:hypothetical protein
MGILEGKTILVTGVTMTSSIAYKVAEIAAAGGRPRPGLELRPGAEPDQPRS